MSWLKIIGFVEEKKVIALVTVIVALFISGQAKSFKIKRLEAEVNLISAKLNETEAENGKLRRSLAAVKTAAQAQAALNNLALSRRDKIDGLALGQTVARPDEVISEKDSRRIIDLFNGDIFSPFSCGMRPENTGRGADNLPRAATAADGEAESGQPRGRA